MMQKIYAFYKGEKYLMSGTQEEICEKMNKTLVEIYNLRAKRQRERYWTGYDREKNTGRTNNVSYIFHICDEDDGYILTATKGLQCYTFLRYEDASNWIHNDLKKSLKEKNTISNIRKSVATGGTFCEYKWRMVFDEPVKRFVYTKNGCVYEVCKMQEKWIIAKDKKMIASFESMAVAQMVLDTYADDNELMYLYSIEENGENDGYQKSHLQEKTIKGFL